MVLGSCADVDGGIANDAGDDGGKYAARIARVAYVVVGQHRVASAANGVRAGRPQTCRTHRECASFVLPCIAHRHQCPIRATLDARF